MFFYSAKLETDVLLLVLLPVRRIGGGGGAYTGENNVLFFHIENDYFLFNESDTL